MAPVLKFRKWTPEEKKAVYDDYNADIPQSVIAKKYGCSINAISGMISRARLAGLNIGPRKVSAKSTKTKVIDPVPKPPKRPWRGPSQGLDPKALKLEGLRNRRIRLQLIVDAIKPSEHSVTLEQLEVQHCRFPIGDPHSPDFMFCGKPRLIPLPYCRACCEIAYYPRH